MALTYTTLNKVKQLLLSNFSLHQGGRRIDFSESYLNLAPGEDNVGNVALSRVDFDDSYWGQAQFQATFTDTTTVAYVIQPDPNQNEVSLGSGTRFDPFTATNPYTSTDMFTVSPSYWSGYSAVGDLFGWRSNAILSNEFAETIIEGAEFCIDSGILRSQKVSNSDRTQLIFSTTATTPKPLQIAAMYLGAYMLYSAVHASSELSESEAFQWFQLAKNLVDDYVRSLPSQGPQWLSRPGMVSMSDRDDTGNPTFDGMALRQTVTLSMDTVQSYIRKYKKNVDYINYISPATVSLTD